MMVAACPIQVIRATKSRPVSPFAGLLLNKQMQDLTMLRVVLHFSWLPETPKACGPPLRA